MSLAVKILLIIVVVLAIVLVVLYFLGKKAEKRQAEQQEKLDAAAGLPPFPGRILCYGRWTETGGGCYREKQNRNCPYLYS